MMASEIYEPGRIRLVDVSPAELDGTPDRLLFKPELGCLCGSDIPYFNRRAVPPKIGHSMHEIIGRVLATTGQRFQVGDRLLCKEPEQRGLRERFILDEAEAVTLEPGLSDEQAVLSQPLGTVVYGLRKLPDLTDATVAVVGQGPIGQLFCAALRSRRARQIIAVDPIAHRLQVSLKMGATDAVNAAAGDPVAAVRRLTGGVGADLVVEAVGHQEFALNACVQMCRHDGAVMQFGIPPHDGAGLNLREIFRKNLRVYTSVGPDPVRDYGEAMRWIREGVVDVMPIVTHRLPIERVQEAFELYRDRSDGALKVFIEFPAE
jgi:threonine dehydrogenase-like Zn-dependent dehydrogenase